ncbi:GNAT family N-acetyltransferase [Aquabacterium sp. A7-Y]|uniref:GNAT family N-acetyltransferase n=1 Tax=Aquabacterium sp. A7-Y TaxID=1349605 RepID=UPI00223E1C1D|nr:GNAT family N-acetyltransferase [Aquabacterium sp. A7-Y]MCW7538674.1 GNAT family N-acetyltransferase [Aquabacterium sp. A7-Y]
MMIRPTSESDWSALRAIRLRSLEDAPEAFGLRHIDALGFSEAQWRERASATTSPWFWLAFEGPGEGARPVGLVGGVVTGGDCELISMWVEPAARGSGVAAALVRQVLDHARSLGHRRVVLSVSPENRRASRFYLGQGFGFLPERRPLESHPSVIVQTMALPLQAVPAWPGESVHE